MRDLTPKRGDAVETVVIGFLAVVALMQIAGVVAWLVGPDSQPITGRVIDAEAGFRRRLE